MPHGVIPPVSWADAITVARLGSLPDALIQALTRPEKDTLWHQDTRGAKIDVREMGVRGRTRIARGSTLS